jgi:Superinfection exclusion gene product 17
MAKEKEPNIGDLRIWWISQIPGPVFNAPVSMLDEGVRLLDTLARYDLFQLENNIKPDFCNAGGIQRYEVDGAEEEGGGPGWIDWYDEESGEDDPRQYLEEKRARENPV